MFRLDGVCPIEAELHRTPPDSSGAPAAVICGGVCEGGWGEGRSWYERVGVVLLSMRCDELEQAEMHGVSPESSRFPSSSLSSVVECGGGG